MRLQAWIDCETTGLVEMAGCLSWSAIDFGMCKNKLWLTTQFRCPVVCPGLIYILICARKDCGDKHMFRCLVDCPDLLHGFVCVQEEVYSTFLPEPRHNHAFIHSDICICIKALL